MALAHSLNVESRMDVIARAIRSHRYRYDSEAELHTGLARVFRDHAIDVIHEHEVESGRLDFFVDGIAIEVKTKDPLALVTRQLHRYAGEACIRGLILVTNRSQLLRVPEVLSGKPLHVCFLPRSIV